MRNVGRMPEVQAESERRLEPKLTDFLENTETRTVYVSQEWKCVKIHFLMVLSRIVIEPVTKGLQPA